MIAKQIKVGGLYVAKVNNGLTVVRVDKTELDYRGRKVYRVTNTRTGRSTTFCSAANFRYEAESQTEKVYQTKPEPVAPVEKPTVEPRFNTTGATTGRTYQEEPATPAPVVKPVVESAPATVGEKLTKLMQNDLSEAQPSPAATTYEPTALVAGYNPTEEQRAVLEAALKVGLKVLVIGAGAGTGKTSTLKMIEEVLPGRGQYTAFNSPLVAESKAKFRKAKCNTTHSLAFRAVGRLYAHRLNGARVRSEQVARLLGLEDFEVETPWLETTDADGKKSNGTKTLSAAFLSGQLIVAIRKFCQSADPTITVDHFRYIDGIDDVETLEDGRKVRSRVNNNLVREHLLPYAFAMWNDLASPDGTLPTFTHDCYVKVWQLGRGKDRPVIEADYILLDEGQDTAPVFLDILKQQSHALVILVGDDNQQIYEWRGAVNAMAAFPGAPRCLLSQSFRFGQSVADVANTILARLSEKTDLVMKGLESIPSRVCRVEAPRCYLFRTNAGAVGRLLTALDSGQRGHLVGGGDDVIKFVRAARDLQSNRPTQHPELCCFTSWKEVREYSKTDEGSDLKLMVNLIEEFGCDKILAALENMPAEKDADFITCTAHKSKGREWASVKLGGDFPPSNRMTDADIRLLYVAATRAQGELDITDCPPFLNVRNQDGSESPAIAIRYTKEMPTAEALEAYRAGKGKAAAPAPVKVEPKANGNSNGLPDGATFSWAKIDDSWLVSGPAGYEGQIVTVTRRNGSTSREMLGKALKTIGSYTFYYVTR